MDEIHKLIDEIINMQKELFYSIKPIVINIIKSRSKDTIIIEKYLDILLNMHIEEAHELFFVLCDYYSTFDKESSEFYLNEYKEIYEDEIIK